MRICVVALGKIGLPLAVQFAAKGHTGRRCRRQPRRSSTLVNAGVSRSPARPSWPSSSPQVVERRSADRHHRHRRGRRRGRRGRRRRAALRGRRRACRTSAGWTPPRGRSPRACGPGTLVSYETTLPVGTTREPLGADAGGRAPGSSAGQDFHLVFSPERVLTGRVFADLRRYPKLVGGIDEASAERGVALLRGGARLRRARRPGPPERRVGPGLGRGGRAGQARRDHLPGRQHRPGQPVRPLRRHASASTSSR